MQAPQPDPILDLIAQAAGNDALRAIWGAVERGWQPEHTDAVRARLVELGEWTT